ncbi:hypothetical protein Q3G72_032587 [Acer saccharum]|nr:hypothetical protein Q3G72_032587 [Acer saccharum]
MTTIRRPIASPERIRDIQFARPTPISIGATADREFVVVVVLAMRYRDDDQDEEYGDGKVETAAALRPHRCFSLGFHLRPRQRCFSFRRRCRVTATAFHFVAVAPLFSLRRCRLVTDAPDFVFTSEIQSPRLFICKVLLDCGAVQADALTVYRLASLKKISDVVPVACCAAADAGIRSVCVTNIQNMSWLLGIITVQYIYKLRSEKECVHAYLQQPKVRVYGRPNSRFITAIVFGVQQGSWIDDAN